MYGRKFSFAVVLLVFVALAAEARYLPTRSNADRIDKLKELLKDIIENEIEKEEYAADAPPRWHPDTKLFYKREASAH